MRLAKREVTGIQEKLAIIEQSRVCRLGLSDKGMPYVVPLNFGYTCEADALVLYFHSAHEGRKIDILKQNNRACFEVDGEHQLLEADTACGHSYAFASVIGFGRIEFIENDDEKIRALNILMKHQTGKDGVYAYTREQLDRVCVYRMVVEEWSGKRRQRKAPH
jgi:nitroimidazol reductase NimA-like FMN-containing flavoprotein (pyridoxamine 5'-phosphate oxidase superfamily)